MKKLVIPDCNDGEQIKEAVAFATKFELQDMLHDHENLQYPKIHYLRTIEDINKELARLEQKRYSDYDRTTITTALQFLADCPEDTIMVAIEHSLPLPVLRYIIEVLDFGRIHSQHLVEAYEADPTHHALFDLLAPSISKHQFSSYTLKDWLTVFINHDFDMMLWLNQHGMPVEAAIKEFLSSPVNQSHPQQHFNAVYEFETSEDQENALFAFLNHFADTSFGPAIETFASQQLWGASPACKEAYKQYLVARMQAAPVYLESNAHTIA